MLWVWDEEDTLVTVGSFYKDERLEYYCERLPESKWGTTSYYSEARYMGAF